MSESELLARGIALFNTGRYWEAHEAWEQAWLPDRHGSDRRFYKGLIQIAAGCLHYQRSNRRGTVNKWRSGLDYLGGYPPYHHHVDLGRLTADVTELLESVSAVEWPAGLSLPRLCSEDQ